MYSANISDRSIYWTGVSGAARELGVSRTTVRRMIRRLAVAFTYLEEHPMTTRTWVFPRRDLRKLAAALA